MRRQRALGALRVHCSPPTPCKGTSNDVPPMDTRDRMRTSMIRAKQNEDF